MDRFITLLFEVSGAVVFWAEIISTLLGMVVAVYTSWKVGKLFTGIGDSDVPRLPAHSPR